MTQIPGSESSAAHPDGSRAWTKFSRREFVSRMAAGGGALAAGGLLASCGGSSASTAASATNSSGKIQRGGTLRVAAFGSSADSIDANLTNGNQADAMRGRLLYNGLLSLHPDATNRYDLAEQLIPNGDGTQWHIRLRQGVEFHNGKTLTAQDVIYTFKRQLNPKSPGGAALLLAPISELRAVDKYTVLATMKAPYSSFADQLANAGGYILGIVPEGYDPKAPVGTGPFKYGSFVAGQQSHFPRNPHFWQSGQPYLDAVDVIDSFSDSTAAFNALQAGQVDAYAAAPATFYREAPGAGLSTVVSEPARWQPFVMRVDKPPFTDVRVRQAMRLLVNRHQVVTEAYAGLASVGNDIFSQWDPAYLADAHREQDIEQAKSLLRQAGQGGLHVQLVTGDIATGVLAAAQVLVANASDAGVTVHLNNLPPATVQGPDYLKLTFTQDTWPYSPYLPQVSLSNLPTSPYNETHWDVRAYNKLYARANAITDVNARKDIIQQMMKMDFDSGGYIIPAYTRTLDLTSKRVHGIAITKTGYPLGNQDFGAMWMT